MARSRRKNRTNPTPEPTKAAPPPAAAIEPEPARRAFWDRRRAFFAVAILLTLQAALATRSLIGENPTVDEVIHLPAGLTYLQKGTYRLYHHNPPLVRQIAALPLLGLNLAVPYESPSWQAEPPNKAIFAHEFMRLNAKSYFEFFTQARLLMPVFGILGGLVVFAWSRSLYGEGGGVLSVFLWALCPNILAHTRLVTTDAGATAIGVLATFLFWRYLKHPTWTRAALAGVALGLGQITKFSLLVLYGLWPLLALVALLAGEPIWKSPWKTVLQGLVVVALSVLVIDLGYNFEGVGIPLGRHEFISQTLTRPVPPGMARPAHPDPLLNGAYRYRVNRFRNTWLGSIPSPLPKHYLLGFDDQKIEAEGIPKKFVEPWVTGPEGDRLMGYPVYLDGQLRQTSWWYYYLLTLVYKVPEGTWLLVLLSVGVLAFARSAGASAFDEVAVLLVPAVVVFVMSVFTNINLGLRYVLAVFPYVYISAGKLAPWVGGLKSSSYRATAGAVVGLGLLANVAAVALIHPHYLAYFNSVSGGPARGAEHLIDSNIDWGQDLVGLQRWAAENAPGERIGLAYFGQVNPRIFDARGESFNWFLPPPEPDPKAMPDLPPRYSLGPTLKGPEPGLYAVSASLVKGLPWRVYDSPWQGFDVERWRPRQAWFNAFAYFQDLTPVAKVGYSIWIYRITPEDSSRLARYWEKDAPRRPQPPD